MQNVYSKPDSQSGSANRRGFTLVELLISMGILLIIALVMGKMFGDTTRIFEREMNRSEMNTSAQAAMELISRELSLAIFTSNSLPMQVVYSEYSLAGITKRNDTLNFVAPINKSTDLALPPYNTGEKAREIQPLKYDLNSEDKVLRRSSRNRNEVLAEIRDLYSGDEPTETIGGEYQSRDLLENVICFQVDYGITLQGEGDPSSFANTGLGDTMSSEKLTYLDIYLEILPSDILQKVNLLADSNEEKAEELVKHNVKSYSRRIFFHNANGYYKPNR